MKRILALAIALSLVLSACSNATKFSSESEIPVSKQAHGDRFSFEVQPSQVEVDPELESVFLSINLKPNDPSQPFTSPWSQQVLVEDGLVDLPSEVVDIWLWSESQNELNLQVGDNVTLRIVNTNAEVLAEFQVQITGVTHITK